MYTRLAAVLSAVALAGCPWCPGPPNGPEQPTDAGTVHVEPVPPVPDCGSVCDHWRELGCEEGFGSPKGAACEAVCSNVQRSGILVWDLVCMGSVSSCTELEQCVD